MKNAGTVGLRRILAAAVGVLVSGIVTSTPMALAAQSQEPYVIGAVFDITGPGAPLGAPEEATAKLVVKRINDKGGINGHPIKLITYDNASDESKSVMAVKKLIESDKVLAIIGPSQTGTTLAASDTVNSSKIPLVSCAAGVGIIKPVKPYIFKTAQSDVHAVSKVLDHLKAIKVKKIALLTVSNAFGDSGKEQFELQAPKAGISIVAQEGFGDKDTDMTAQLMKIRRSEAKAVVCWGTNPGPAIVARNMRNLGIDLPLIMSHGIGNRKFIELAGDAAEGVVFPAGKLLVVDQIPASDPQKKVLTAYAADFKKEYGKEADTFGGHAYDAINLVIAAIREVGPDREKIRQALEDTQGFIGISGVFDFGKADHNGLSKDAFEMVVIKKGDWQLYK